MDAAGEAEFRQFVETRRQQLLRTAYLLTGDRGRGEDLVQIALVRAHRNWRRITRSDAPEAYIRQILVNLNNSWWRRWKRVGDLPTDRLPEVSTPDEHAAYDRYDELWHALALLPPRMRAVLVLRYYADLTEADTARTLGCSVGTVKSQASRGLDRLRSALGQPADPEAVPYANPSAFETTRSDR